MTLIQLRNELEELTQPGNIQVLYFDGAQTWEIELMVATHRTGNTVWIKRMPRTAEQSLLEACESVRAFLKALELQAEDVSTGAADPLLKIRREVHRPLLEKLDSAIAQFKRGNEIK
jgi:hypothetical protein